MPLWVLNFIGGMFLGYYLLNDTVRHLVNQILITLLKLAHRLVVFLLAGILKGLIWCYAPRQNAQQPVQRIPPTRTAGQPTQKQATGARTVVLDDGSRAIQTTSDEVEKWLKNNPDIKVSERKKTE